VLNITAVSSFIVIINVLSWKLSLDSIHKKLKIHVQVYALSGFIYIVVFLYVLHWFSVACHIENVTTAVVHIIFLLSSDEPL